MESIVMEKCVDSGDNIVVQLLKAITRKLSKMTRDNYQPEGMNIIFPAPHYSPGYYAPNGLNLGNGYSASLFLMYLYFTHKNKREEIANKGGLPVHWQPLFHYEQQIQKTN